MVMFSDQGLFASVLRSILLLALSPLVVQAQSSGVVTNSVGMRLIPIEPGTFTMGISDQLLGKVQNWRRVNAPKHKVRVSQPYYLGAIEVTEAQWKAVVGARSRLPQARSNYPACMMSWGDAVEFCDALSNLPEERAAGRVYRLPTEAEWEYACRAETDTDFYFGDDIDKLGDFAWFEGNCRDGKTAPGIRPVKQKIPNAWGLYDMYGNVSEFCADVFAPYPKESGTIKVDPRGPKDGNEHVLRGGAWGSHPVQCSSGYRSATTGASNSLGFRVAMNINGQALVAETIEEIQLAELNLTDEVESRPNRSRDEDPLTIRRSVNTYLSRGMDPNSEGQDGESILFNAIEDVRYMREEKDIYEQNLLACLHFGADPNSMDANGRTALHYAVERGRSRAVEHLMRYGADPQIVNKEGKTALELAKSRNSQSATYYMLNPPEAPLRRKYQAPTVLKSPHRTFGGGRFRAPEIGSAITYSADGKLLVVAEPERKVHVYDADTGKEKLAYNAAYYRIRNLVALNDDILVASGDIGSHIQFSDLRTGKEILRLKGEGGPLILSPNQKLLYAGNRLFEIESTNPLKLSPSVRLFRKSHGRREIAMPFFSPDSSILVLTQGEKAWCWNLKSNEVKQLDDLKPQLNAEVLWNDIYAQIGQPAQTDEIMAVYRPQRGFGLTPVSYSLWSEQENLRSQQLAQSGNGYWQPSFAVSPDGKRIAALGPAMHVGVFDRATMKSVLSSVGHQSSVERITSSSDGRLLVSGDRDGRLVIWKTESGEVVKEIELGSRVRALSFSNDRLFVGLEEGLLCLDTAEWKSQRLLSNRMLRFLHFDAKHERMFALTESLLAVYDSRTAELLASTTLRGRCKTLAILPELPANPDSDSQSCRVLVTHMPPRAGYPLPDYSFRRLKGNEFSRLDQATEEKRLKIEMVAFDASKGVLAVRSRMNNAIVIADAEEFLSSRAEIVEQARIASWPMPTKYQFSSSGKYLLYTEGSALRIWDVEAQRNRLVLNSDAGTIYDFTVLPNGLIATANANQTVYLWKIAQYLQLSP